VKGSLKLKFTKYMNKMHLLNADENNLMFSIVENPEKSKTKCFFMCGKLGNVQYPAALKLYGLEKPWVVKGTHLGHELHQSCNMDFDAKCKRVAFTAKST
jgi:hypothetical protein